MNPVIRLIPFPVFFLALTFWGGPAFPAAVSSPCPSKEKLQQTIQRSFPKLQFEIVRTDSSKMKGLCQIQLKINQQMHLIYSDAPGEFLFAGTLYEAKTGRNLTQETVQVLNRLTPEEFTQIESLTAFTLGQGKKVVYLVTNPQCPYCKQAETLVKKLIPKEDISVRFLLFPFDSQKEAKEQCISILCDNKGIEGFDNGYRSDNQCAEGTKKINNTIAFMQKKGINSTPTFIFMDGIFNSGVPTEEVFRSRLGLPKAPSK